MKPALYEQYLAAKAENSGKYARDLAAWLNISEAELTYARVGHDAKRLTGDVRTLLAALEAVGEVKAITRNEYAVHEQVGDYRNQHLNGHAGLILNPRALDLRLFLQRWAYTFMLKEDSRHGVRQSIQFFDHQGDALHKVYTTDNTHMAAWEALIARYVSEQNPPLKLQAVDPQTPITHSIDAALVESEWRAMTNIHQFFLLLKRHNLTRQQAFSTVSDDLAYRVTNGALREILIAAQQQQNEIMVFVSNRGCVQIFTGKIERVVPHQQWINVFNKHFTLHLIENAIAESWVTRKPTKEGMVTSLELFAADGTHIAQLFGQRTEGQPEQTQWRAQIAALISDKAA